MVTNRTYERASLLAQQLSGRAVPFRNLRQALAEADIVLTATGSSDYVVTREAVAEVMATRGERPLFLVDIAVPRDVEPSVAEISGVRLFNIDDLQSVAAANQDARQREVARVEAIVDAEVVRFLGWWHALEAEPVIAALRAKVEAIRQEELRKVLRRLGHLSPQDQAHIDALTVTLINKILHDHFEHMRSGAGAETLRNVYHLDGDTEQGDSHR
jgi:glutamyl-tRNA reductase